MACYKKMYYAMFNAMTDAADLMESAAAALKKAQLDCEEIYMRAGDRDKLIQLPENPRE